MSVALWISLVGMVLMALGFVAMCVAPKIPPENADQPGAWVTPDDYSVQPWTAVLFALGFYLGLSGAVSVGIARDQGLPESVVFSWIQIGVLALVLFGRAVHWLTRRSGQHPGRTEEFTRGGARD